MMGTVTTRDDEQKNLTTADIAAAAAPRERGDDVRADDVRNDEALAPLFTPDTADGFRSRWDAVQIGFVDDPAKAVRDADELVAQVMKTLADSFAQERARFDEEMAQAGNAATENQRVALRRYRSFFQRLLSL
jgi:hypothetical protein